MQTYNCRNGCCNIKVKKYKRNKSRKFYRNYKKAGVFLYDPKQDRVLLVQSRGYLWGPPKGSLNFGENSYFGAIREVKEETGIDISNVVFHNYVKIKKRSIYYYHEMDSCVVSIQNTIKDNDANGISWIKIGCLQESITDGHIVLNHHAKIVFYRLKNIIFPKSNWTLVKRRK